MFHSTGGSTAGGWNIWANGYISATHDFSDGAATLWITAKGQRGGGTWPHMRVLVGGQLIDDFNVASADWTTYPVGVSDVVGTQEIRIEFDNDYYGGAGNDRNLLVDKLVVDCSSAETLSAYAFETDVMGWTNVSAPGTGSSVSSAQAFDGNSSLALSVFGWGDPTIDVAPTTSPAAGSTITVRVFVPSGAPINAVSPYVLDANWHWTDGYADSFSTGQWQTFTVVVPNDAVLPLNRIGVKFYESAPYTGDLYIDAVEW